jgi:catalase
LDFRESISERGNRLPLKFAAQAAEVANYVDRRLRLGARLVASDAAKQPPNFLMDELPERLKRGPVTFQLRAQLAAAGDSTKDPIIAWPNDRKVVELAILTIEKAVPNSAEMEKKLLFLPGELTDGIEESDDPLIDVRNGAYALSFSRRNQ